MLDRAIRPRFEAMTSRIDRKDDKNCHWTGAGYTLT
jgi:hypothetical protein